MTTPGAQPGGSSQAGQTGQPQQGTNVFVYAPDVNVYIATQTGVIDVSEDIVKGQLRRVENSVSQFNVVLNNIKKQYTQVIKRMDRIVVFMTRTQRLQVFAGYVDTAPFLDLYPTTCTIQASCTLKRLLYTYWDPGLPNSEQILDQHTYMNPGAGGAGGAGANSAAIPAGAGNPTAQPLDSGLGAMLQALLTKVGGWDANNIKIQDFPKEFLQSTVATSTDPNFYLTAIKQMQDLLGIVGSQSAGGAGGGGDGGTPYTGNGAGAAGNYGGTSLNADQVANANAIIAAGKARGESQQGINIALMTAMQESSLRNSPVATDHDSVGLFQQRPSQGWGSPAQIMDPAYASNKFYDGLNKVPNWQSMDPGAAAQAVQRSAYPGAYTKWGPLASALTGSPTAGQGGAGAPPGGAPPAGAQQPGGTTGGGGADVPKYVYGLFNTMFNTGAFRDEMSFILKGNKALINDQQLMSMIQSVSKASLRSFQSGPDGQFVAYYPDYFGLHSGANTFKVEDIEMKNVSIQISDAPLATHVYTVGDTFTGLGTLMTQSPETAWLATKGVMTIEDQDVFKFMLNIDPAQSQDFTPEAIYKRFGARPLVITMPMVKTEMMEKFQAIHVFMQKWAEQYSTKVDITFMPELFPGMRLELSGHSLAVYVKEVVHNFDRKLGFTTEVTICAPSTTGGGLPGLPISHSGPITAPLASGQGQNLNRLSGPGGDL